MKIRVPEPIPKRLNISGIFERSPFELTPFKHNARKHSPEQIVKLIAGIREFGFTSTVLADENWVILSGHARVEAARQMNLESVPVRIITGLTEAQKRAFVISDNKIGLLSSWDMEQLEIELDWLAEVDYPQELTAFSTAEIDIITDPEAANADQEPAEGVKMQDTVPHRPKCCRDHDAREQDRNQVVVSFEDQRDAFDLPVRFPEIHVGKRQRGTHEQEWHDDQKGNAGRKKFRVTAQIKLS